jgi:hypothetical protein
VGGGACWAAGAGAVRHEAGKLRKVYLSVAVQVGLRNHGLDLGLRQRLPEVVHRQSELLLRDEAVSVAIEDLQRGGSFSQKIESANPAQWATPGISYCSVESAVS